MTRSQLLAQLDRDHEWDVVVIGGGSTGLGIALEAASRNYKTLLVEQSDFAKSTSSKSTKLIHGGVRYLSQGHFGLVREASVERAYLLKNAPHLVRNQTFIIPVFNSWDALKYTVALKLYDWIAGSSSLGSAKFLTTKKIDQDLPNVTKEHLLGGIIYHDGQFDDARLAINLAQTVIDLGGVALNYLKVKSILKNKEGNIEGVEVVDQESQRIFRIYSKSVVNATGVFADEVLRMDNFKAEKTIQVSQGTHIVLDRKFFPSNNALMIPKTPDGRVLFLIPWYNKILVGTTDSPVPEASLEPVATKEEINFILETASVYLESKPTEKDVESVFAGLRPLAAQTGTKVQTKEISRNYKIIVSPSYLFTIVGGKWTTYRRMGEEMITRIEKDLHWEKRKAVTNNLRIHGWMEKTDVANPLSFYGSDLPPIQQAIAKDEGGWISRALSIHKAQVNWAVENEMARTVEDVLARRTRALLLDARESMRVASVVARVMSESMQKDEAWIEEQVEAYTSLAKNYILA